ncbi:MAG: beta-ketoacyl synthase N-terminal-like domain-containing protein, partial [Candidatus Regiella insecticola]|nr:beta-ketoacyl synthase N-terminal-like domain-containing protein [Candidatus Regiella insecticola]
WGNVKLDTATLIERKTLRFMSDASIYAYLAMQESIKNAGLSNQKVSNFRTGLVVGSGGGSPRNQMVACDGMRAKGLRGVGPYMVTRAMASGVSACLATPFKIKG